MIYASFAFTILVIVFLAAARRFRLRNAISPSMGTRADEWDAIFTQDGPGKGLEPTGSPGWTGGDSTYSFASERRYGIFLF